MPVPATCPGTDWGAIVHEHGDAVWRLACRLPPRTLSPLVTWESHLLMLRRFSHWPRLHL